MGAERRQEPGLSPAASVRRAVRAVLWALVAVAAGSQVPAGLELPLASSLAGDLPCQGCFRPESGLRWTGGAATLVFPDTGLGRPLTAEVELDGWRPGNLPGPIVELEAGGRRLTQPVGRRQTLALEAPASGIWRPQLRLHVRSETFVPGRHDPRRLGVRLRSARLRFGPGVAIPSPASLAWAALAAAWVALWFGGGPGRRGRRWALPVLASALALGHALAPVWAAWLVPAVTLGAVALSFLGWASARVAPGLASGLRHAAEEARAGLLRAGALFPTRAGALAVLAAALAFVAAQRAISVVDVDLASSRSVLVARGFGPWDSWQGRSCRVVRPGSALDFSALGSGRYLVTLSVARPQPARGLALGTVDDRSVVSDIGPEWRSVRLDLGATGPGRPGPVLRLAREASGAYVAAVRIERRGGLPAPLVWLAGLLAGALAALPAALLGLPRRVSWLGATLVWGLAATACALDPAVAWPHLPALLLVVLAASLLALALAAAGARPTPAVCLAAVAGFALWLGATTWPLYRGGHFGFHSQIAEEIWNGRFLTYYLPYPGSMLSRQAQWGNVIVPHPCLFHVLAAPLSALPAAGFAWALKAGLALALASLALLAGAVAQRLAGPRAGSWASAAFAALVPTYQLLGLGHLMTLLGLWAGSFTIVFLLWRAGQLDRRGTRWAALGLLTLAFLSYTATLLFTGLVASALLLRAWRREPVVLRPLFRVVALASLAAFGLYYAYWAWPFVVDSLPHLLSGARIRPDASTADRWARLAAQPGKLAYTFGFAWVPLLALAGLWKSPAGRQRFGLVAWLLLLPLFSGLDLWFNFLLKHHYFVVLPVAVGLGLALEWVWQQGRKGRWLAAGLAATLVARGLFEAWAVATGRIP